MPSVVTFVTNSISLIYIIRIVSAFHLLPDSSSITLAAALMLWIASYRIDVERLRGQWIVDNISDDPSIAGRSGGRPRKNPNKNTRVLPTLKDAWINYNESKKLRLLASIPDDLWIARDMLAIRTGRPSKLVANATNYSWSQYCEAIGTTKSTAS